MMFTCYGMKVIMLMTVILSFNLLVKYKENVNFPNLYHMAMSNFSDISPFELVSL